MLYLINQDLRKGAVEMAEKIFVVEDDPVIAAGLERELTKWHYQVQRAEDFEAIDQECRRFAPHLVLLDLNLPSYDGYYWCQMIRKDSDVPILFLSARDTSMDQVMAMQVGGDDYVTKPIDLPLLLAKVQALLRRAYRYNSASEILAFAGVQLDPTKARLLYQGQASDLTATELLILKQLFQAQGDYVSRESLMEECWLGETYIDDNTLAVNISRLRKKLSDMGLADFIKTKKRVGYALNEEVASQWKTFWSASLWL